MIRTALLVVACLLLEPVSSVRADDWPQFRGALASSVAGDAPLPSSWSAETEENIGWSVDLPGKGVSGPIVIGGKVIVTASGGPREERLHVLAFDSATGKQLWHRQFWATGRTLCYDTSAVAAATPASDGERVFALFSSNDLVALTLEGDLLWNRALAIEHPGVGNDIGMASSPTVGDGAVVVQCESQGASFAAAFEAASGAERWEVERPKESSWSSPVAGPGGVCLQSGKGVELLSLETGEPIWRQEIECAGIPSPTPADGLVLVASEGLTAVDAEGDAAGEVRWREGGLQVANASPVALGDRLLMLNRAGVLICASIADGSTNWKRRLGGSFWSTPVVSGGRAYCFNQEGEGFVVELEDGKVVGEGAMKDSIYCSPAIADGGLFVRSHGKLWKIASKSTARGGDARRL